MTDYAVWNGATGAGTGLNWTDAVPSVRDSFILAGSGDRVFLASDHDEGNDNILAMDYSAASINPVVLISADRTAGWPVPSTAFQFGAIINVLVQDNINFNNAMAAFGIDFNTVPDVLFNANSFFIGIGNRWHLSSGGVRNAEMEFRARDSRVYLENSPIQNTDVTFDNNFISSMEGGHAWIRHCDFSSLGLKQVHYWGNVLQRGGHLKQDACDLSDFADAARLLDDDAIYQGNDGSTVQYEVWGCGLPTNGIIYDAATWDTFGPRIVTRSVDSEGKFERTHDQDFCGTIKTSDTIYRNGKAEASGQPFSYQIAARATTIPGLMDKTCELVTFSSPTANPTVTIELAHAGALRTNLEIYADIIAPSAADPATPVLVTSRPANILGSGATLDSSTASWTGGGALTKSRIVLPVVGGAAGQHKVILRVATGSDFTLYADPMVDLS